MPVPHRPPPAPRWHVDPRRFIALSRRVPIARLAVAVLLAIVVTVGVQHRTTSLRIEQHRWGQGAPTLVATAAVDAGATLSDLTTELREVPIGLRPADALDSLPDDARARVSLTPGEVIRAERVAPTGSALAARQPPDSRGVALRTDQVVGLETGDLVDIHDALSGHRLADDAPITRIDDQGAIVAVQRSAVEDVVAAIGGAGLVIVLVG